MDFLNVILLEEALTGSSCLTFVVVVAALATSGSLSASTAGF